MSENHNNSVCVLLASYNGEKYIQDQVQSILAQDYGEIDIFIVDDFSTDNTAVLVQRFQELHPNIRVKINKNNLGPTANFLSMLSLHGHNYDYVFFCDQDDFWLPNKITRAVEQISSLTSPALYCSNCCLVDENLNLISEQRWEFVPEFTFGNALIENFAQGCTIALNRKAVKLLNSCEYRNIQGIILHDWWCYLIVSAFGEVIYDPKPTMLYRLHANNVAGHNFGFERMKIRIKKALTLNVFDPTKQLQIFHEQFKHKISSDKKAVLNKYPFLHKNEFTFQNMISFIFDGQIVRQVSRFDSFIYKIAICLSKTIFRRY